MHSCRCSATLVWACSSIDGPAACFVLACTSRAITAAMHNDGTPIQKQSASRERFSAGLCRAKAIAKIPVQAAVINRNMIASDVATYIMHLVVGEMGCGVSAVSGLAAMPIFATEVLAKYAVRQASTMPP
jgi:hypothetical protein